MQYCGRQIGSMPPSKHYFSAGPLCPSITFFQQGNAFHGACLAKEVMAAAAPQQQKDIQSLLTQLNQVLRYWYSYLHASLSPKCSAK